MATGCQVEVFVAVGYGTAGGGIRGCGLRDGRWR